jgi:hypothetical protein
VRLDEEAEVADAVVASDTAAVLLPAKEASLLRAIAIGRVATLELASTVGVWNTVAMEEESNARALCWGTGCSGGCCESTADRGTAGSSIVSASSGALLWSCACAGCVGGSGCASEEESAEDVGETRVGGMHWCELSAAADVDNAGEIAEEDNLDEAEGKEEEEEEEEGGDGDVDDEDATNEDDDDEQHAEEETGVADVIGDCVAAAAEADTEKVAGTGAEERGESSEQPVSSVEHINGTGVRLSSPADVELLSEESACRKS